MTEKQIVVSQEYTRSKFKKLGFALILYSLIVLYLPLFLEKILEKFKPEILENLNLYIGIYYIIVLFGTIVPFLIISKTFDTKFSDFFRKTNISFSDTRIEFLVFFTISSISIFIANGIANVLGVSMNLVFNVGAVASNTHFDNFLFAYMYIIACPILEEIAFRGCLLKSLARFGKKFAIIVSAIFYALAHGEFIEMIPAIIMGYLLGKIETKYHSVQPCIIMRILFNILIFILYLVPDSFSFIVSIIFVFVYLYTLFYSVRKKYTFVAIKSAQSILPTLKVLLTTPEIIIAILLVIGNSVLTEVFIVQGLL